MANQSNKLALGDFPVNLSQPALRALQAGGYKMLHDLTKVTEKEVTDLHGMGPKGVRTLKESLAARELAFKKED